VQQRLQVLGYLNDSAVDGVYGPTTATAVRRFQQRHDLVPDSQVGQRTWDALFSAEAKAAEAKARASAVPGAQR
jgi:peptidoglycan hydrolase-like protein with peptidoglycan-binding domain